MVAFVELESFDGFGSVVVGLTADGWPKLASGSFSDPIWPFGASSLSILLVRSLSKMDMRFPDGMREVGG